VGFLPALGTAAPWALYVLGIHVLWSILVPVAIVEMLFPQRRTQPWLGRIGLGVVAVLFAVLVAVLTAGMAAQTKFFALPIQFAGVAVMTILAVALAFFAIPAKPAARRLPSATTVAVGSFVAGSAFLLVYSQGVFVFHWPWQWISAGLAVLLAAMAGIGIAAANNTRWTDWHRLAAATGGLAVYGWFGFITEASLHGTSGIGAHAVLAVVCMALPVVAAIRLRRAGTTS